MPKRTNSADSRPGIIRNTRACSPHLSWVWNPNTEQWLAASENHRAAFDRIQSTWHAIDRYATGNVAWPSDAEVASDTYDGSVSVSDWRARVATRRASRRQPWLTVGLAAAAALAVLAVLPVMRFLQFAPPVVTVVETAAGENRDVPLSDGSVAAGIPVEVTLTQVQWTSVRRAEGNGFYTWDTERREIESGKWTVTTATEPVPLEIAFKNGGYYMLEARAREDGERFAVTRTSFYVLGDGYTAWARFDHNRIDLVFRQQLSNRNTGAGRETRQRHHRVAVSTQNKRRDVLNGNVQRFGQETTHASRVEHAGHSDNTMLWKSRAPEGNLAHRIERIRDDDQDRIW